MYISFGSGFYAYVWVATGLLTFFVPLAYRTMRVKDFQALNMAYNWDQQWEQQKQQYEAQQDYYMNQEYWNGGGEGGGNAQQYNNYGAQYYEQMRQGYDANNCRWWQFGCYPYYINYDGEPEPGAGWYPNWYSGFSKTEQQQEAMQEAGIVSRSMRFVYIWQMLLFAVLVGYGFLVLKQDRPLTGLIVALVVFANMCFLSMWWLADGSIVTDAEYVQLTGFYGQFAVLMFITNAAYVIFGIVHTALLYWYGHVQQEEQEEIAKREHNADGIAEDESGWTAPTIKATTVPTNKISPDESGWTVVH